MIFSTSGRLIAVTAEPIGTYDLVVSHNINLPICYAFDDPSISANFKIVTDMI